MFYESIVPPNKIEKDLISEADLEIRYTHDFPDEALFGILMPLFVKLTNNNLAKIQNLQPIPFPEDILKLNPELIYQSKYKYETNNFSFAIGNNSILFTVSKPYSGWINWKAFFQPILNEIEKLNIVHSITRIGLRYIDIAEGDLIPNTDLTLKIKSDFFNTGGYPISFYTNFKAGKYFTNIRVDNNGIFLNKKSTSIDVDCYIDEVQLTNKSVEDSINLIEELHVLNKKIFFGLFTDEFINKLNPM